MNTYLRSLRTEIRYQVWGKTLLWVVAVVLIGLGIALTGATSNTGATHERFVSTLAQAEANGVSLADALAHPANTRVQDGQTLIDNPLRFDYEQAQSARNAFEPANMVGTGLEMITFVLFPVLFFVYGSVIAVNDAKRRILKQRVTLEGRWPVLTAKATALVGVALACVLLCAGLSLIASPLIQALFIPPPAGEFPSGVMPGAGAGALGQIAFSAATATAFGLLGFFVGVATRAVLIPALAAVALLMVAPFAGAYDPRNILSMAGQHVFNFWGGFTPRPLFQVDPALGSMALVIALFIIGAGSAIVWARRSQYS